MRLIQVSDLLKPCISSDWAGKGHIVLLDQTTKVTLEAQRAQYPLVEASKNTGVVADT